jgi:hypothetical protein
MMFPQNGRLLGGRHAAPGRYGPSDDSYRRADDPDNANVAQTITRSSAFRRRIAEKS